MANYIKTNILRFLGRIGGNLSIIAKVPEVANYTKTKILRFLGGLGDNLSIVANVPNVASYIAACC